MSRIELPVSVLDRVLGTRRAYRHDEPVLAQVERALRQLEPDPLFRRRLRGSVVNYYVATREGHLRRRSRRSRRQMGALGRSVLYASLVLALGVTAVGAAAQDSLPGEALYGVKLRLEEVRMYIAPPSVRDDLAQLILAERIDELQELAGSGAWGLVPAAADRVARAEEDLVAVSPGSTAGAASTDAATEALRDVLANAPQPARAGLQRAIQASSSVASGTIARRQLPGPGAAVDKPQASQAADPGSRANGSRDGRAHPKDTSQPD